MDVPAARCHAAIRDDREGFFVFLTVARFRLKEILRVPPVQLRLTVERQPLARVEFLAGMYVDTAGLVVINSRKSTFAATRSRYSSNVSFSCTSMSFTVRQLISRVSTMPNSSQNVSHTLELHGAALVFRGLRRNGRVLPAGHHHFCEGLICRCLSTL